MLRRLKRAFGDVDGDLEDSTRRRLEAMQTTYDALLVKPDTEDEESVSEICARRIARLNSFFLQADLDDVEFSSEMTQKFLRAGQVICAIEGLARKGYIDPLLWDSFEKRLSELAEEAVYRRSHCKKVTEAFLGALESSQLFYDSWREEGYEDGPCWTGTEETARLMIAILDANARYSQSLGLEPSAQVSAMLLLRRLWKEIAKGRYPEDIKGHAYRLTLELDALEDVIDTIKDKQELSFELLERHRYDLILQRPVLKRCKEYLPPASKLLVSIALKQYDDAEEAARGRLGGCATVAEKACLEKLAKILEVAQGM